MTIENTNLHSCLTCKKEGISLRCNRCKKAYYCTKECQVKDWKNHKKLCNKLANEKEDKENENVKENSLTQYNDVNNEIDIDDTGKLVPCSTDATKVWDQGSKYYLNKKYNLAAQAYVHAIYLDSTMTLRCKKGDNSLEQLYKRLLNSNVGHRDNFNDIYLKNPYAGILFLYTYCKAYTGENGFLVCFTRLAEKYSDNAYVHLCRGRVFGEMTALLRQKENVKNEPRITLKTQVECLERAYEWFSKETSNYLIPIIYEIAFAYRDIGRIADSLNWYNRFLKESTLDHHARMKAKSAVSFLEKARQHYGDVYVPKN